MKTKEEQLQDVGYLAKALTRLNKLGVIPQQIHYHEYSTPAVVVSLEDLKLIADGRPVEKREDSLITYSFKHAELSNIEIVAYVFGVKLTEPTTVQL